MKPFRYQDQRFCTIGITLGQLKDFASGPEIDKSTNQSVTKKLSVEHDGRQITLEATADLSPGSVDGIDAHYSEHNGNAHIKVGYGVFDQLRILGKINNSQFALYVEDEK